jgi:hypothetical protein
MRRMALGLVGVTIMLLASASPASATLCYLC